MPLAADSYVKESGPETPDPQKKRRPGTFFRRTALFIQLWNYGLFSRRRLRQAPAVSLEQAREEGCRDSQPQFREQHQQGQHSQRGQEIGKRSLKGVLDGDAADRRRDQQTQAVGRGDRKSVV